MSKKADLFFETFAGEMVEILQDFEVTMNVSLTGDGEVQEMRTPMTVSGILLDTDGEFLFLSNDGESVNQALPIHTIKHIGIVGNTDTLQEVLDEIDTPSGGYN